MSEAIRNKNLGEVYTPSHISKLLFDTVNEVHKDFNKTDIVWDCCWGTGNLTKDFEFNRLYCSTLRGIDIRKHRQNNRNAEKFVYDFLNTDVNMLKSLHAMASNVSTLPESLEEGLRQNQPVTFYINPPYVSSSYGKNKAVEKDDVEEFGVDVATGIKHIMEERNLGRDSKQLYVQFLYRIMLMKKAYNNSNIRIGLISPIAFLTLEYFKEFRSQFLKEFHLSNAYLIQANQFKGLSHRFGLGVMLWESGEQEDKNNFSFKVIEDFENIPQEPLIKNVYNADNTITLTQYLSENESDDLEVSEYTASSGVKILNTNNKQAKTSKNSLGCFYFQGNDLAHYVNCGIMTVPNSTSCSMDITEKNADLCVASASARICKGRYGRGWIDWADIFMKPDTTSEEWKRLILNCYLYIQFTGQTHLSSVYAYGRDFNNNLFHLSYEYMDKLFKKYGAEIKTPEKRPDTFAVKRLRELFAQPELIYPYGMELWEAGLKMWDDTMDRRLNGFADPIYQVERWDAGFYQIKQLTKDDNRMLYLKEFNKILKEYEVYITKAVRKVGFMR